MLAATSARPVVMWEGHTTEILVRVTGSTRSAAMILPNFVADPRHLRHLADRMYADDVGAGEDRGRNRRGCRPLTLRRREIGTQRTVQEPLPRRSNQQRAPKFAELVEARQHFVGVDGFLGKAQPG